ncbi:TonB-dependent receptor plug domain-containing protein [Asaia sp. VD9]|uniref:TonB-dependent receptor n=1 Tax=Asaia sp. VD9 TaxID=3081235 RepID=UPI00301830A8
MTLPLETALTRLRPPSLTRAIRLATVAGVFAIPAPAHATDGIVFGPSDTRKRPTDKSPARTPSTTRPVPKGERPTPREAQSAHPGETIIVVGDKLDRLQNTNSAVTILRHLDASEYRSLYDVVNRVPNMIGNAADIPTIRGVTGSGAAGGIFSLMSGSRPRTATIIDGLPETYSGQRYVDAGTWDMEQVSVLRGPQATTQGRNAIGGAITLSSKAPTQFWQAALRGGYESAGSKGVFGGMVSGPILKDELAFRLTTDGMRGNSYIHYPGKAWPFDPREVNQTSVRGKLLWAPKLIPALKVTLQGWHREQHGEYLYMATGPDLSRLRFDNPDMNTRVSRSSIDQASLRASYRLNAALTNELTYGHVWYDALFRQGNALGSINSLGHLALKEQNNTVEDRLVFAPASNWLNGVAGFYFFNRDQNIRSDMGVNGPDAETTYAGYLDGTLHLIGGLSLIAGARVEHEAQTRNVALSWGKVALNSNTTMFLPKGGLSYRFTPVTSASFTVRRGYNPGGGAIDWDNGTYYQYGQETVTTYELGGHTELLDRKLSLNTNLFYNDFHDYQDLLNYTFVNIPHGRSIGLELEAIYHLTRSLHLSGGLGLLDTKILDAPAAYRSVVGKKFSNAPSATLNIGVEKTFHNGLFLGANYNRVGSYTSQVESGTGLIAGNYNVLNAHIGYRTRHYTIRFYTKNLTNETILFSGRTNWAGLQAQMGQPRAFGFTVDGNL